MINNQKFISIAIPTYSYNGLGSKFLKDIFVQLYNQTFKDFDVVVTDHSENDEIVKVCADWNKELSINYFRNSYKRGSGASNTNYAIQKSTGKFIKLICGDDYFFNETSLEITANVLTEDTYWLATAYVHTDDRINYHKYHLPKWNDNILFCNTLGTPSCFTIKNSELPNELFDEDLTYCYDLTGYYKLYKNFSVPKIIDSPTIVNYLHSGSITSVTTQQIIDQEFDIIKKRYG